MRHIPQHILRALRIRGLSVTVIGVAVIVFMAFSYIRQPLFMRILDYKLYDAFLHVYHDKEISPAPAIINLDEQTLAKYGQWPWPRFLVAELLQAIVGLGAASVGVDVLFIEEDRNSPRQFARDFKRFHDVDMRFENVPEQFHDYDALLAQTLKTLPVVLGMYLNFTGQADEDAASPPTVGVIAQKSADAAPYEERISRAPGANLPLKLFWDAAPLGLLNMNPDEDGVVRRIPMLAGYKGKLYLSLSLRSLMLALGQRNVMLRVGPDGLESLRVGNFSIPVSPEGNFTVPFKGPARTYPYYSAKDALDGTLPAGALKGRIVFLGTSAPGLQDIRITPLERVYPGVEVHASALDAVLQQRFLRIPPWTPGAQFLAITLCGLIAAPVFGFARPRVYLFMVAALLGGALYAGAHFFKAGFVVSPLYVMLTIALQGALLLFLRFWQEDRQKNVLRNAFSRYVAPEVVERITKLGGDIFAGEEVEATIMFTDIRRFTAISESLRPEQVVSLLNRYFTPMTALVRGNKGTLDKFIGDALMAFWNAPLPVPGHPALAVRTALAMQDKLKTLNIALQKDFGHEISMGVGLHTGKVFVGNMGSEELLNYTIVGDSVNLASRLERLCPRYGVDVVLSAATRSLCAEDFAFQQLDTLRVKGKEQPLAVFAVVPLEEGAQRLPELEAWQAAFDAYTRGAFPVAGAMADTLSREFPACLLYQIYAQRCRALAANPPHDWDGIWTMTAK
ncbi:MAG: adenylate/guanylate cyclase domain-containing protein [Deltaproteobacteria bacterium]|nr:adenylate/guanylate cyclase domain-containing protein [Deltaproteobacteria bacterium]